MKKLNLRYAMVILVGIFIYSCQENDYLNEEQAQQEESLIEDPFTDIPRLKNPYSVVNMKKALESLRSKSEEEYSDAKIYTTHYYIKFTPRNEKEYDILKTDSVLDLYKYPLDVEEWIIPKLISLNRHSGKPPTMWCAVKVDHEMPKGCPYEILEHLHIPDAYKIGDEKHQKNKSNYVEQLVEESMHLTGNLNRDSSKNISYSNSEWRPAGTINVWDDNIGTTIMTRQVFSHIEYYDCGTGVIYPDCESMDGITELTIPTCCQRDVYISEPYIVNGSFIGVEGVVVRARRWFTTHRGIVNINGNYLCDGTFRRPANYSIDWERYEFALQDGWLNGATYNGPKRTGDWNLDLNSGKQEFYATIFRAAYHYYYKNIKGLRRPPQNSLWRTQMKIRAKYEENGNGSHKEERRFLGAQIKIYSPQRESMEIYASTIHELAHASHWNMDRSEFDNSSPIVKESWARGVEWELTRIVYPTYSPDYSRLRYTGVVEDMIDGFKTRTSKYYWTENITWIPLDKSYSDSVSGYSVRQIEDALQSKKTWTDWKNNIINKFSNGTASKLHDCFNHWNTQ
ncbi:MAG: hypothetical protein ACON42_03505 [Flavobacteriaceae bacterium]